MVMVFAGAHVSGAHYNPAVSLAMVVRREATSTQHLHPSPGRAARTADNHAHPDGADHLILWTPRVRVGVIRGWTGRRCLDASVSAR